MDIKAYRNWLDQHVDLRDWCYNCDGNRLPSRAVEYFRRCPKEPYFEIGGDRARRRIYRLPPLSLKAIRGHRELRGDDTILVTNSRRKTVLLLLMDIDAKNGEPDAQQLAQFVRDEFFDGRCYIEPSRGGNGRHAYFLLDSDGADAHRIKRVMDDVCRIVQGQMADRFRARLDGCYGLPTRWERGPHGEWLIPASFGAGAAGAKRQSSRSETDDFGRGCPLELPDMAYRKRAAFLRLRVLTKGEGRGDGTALPTGLADTLIFDPRRGRLD